MSCIIVIHGCEVSEMLNKYELESQTSQRRVAFGKQNGQLQKAWIISLVNEY